MGSNSNVGENGLDQEAQLGPAVGRQFDMTGAYCLNSANAIANSRDKLLAHQLMAMSGLPMPVTAFASSPYDTDDLIAMVGGPPLIVALFWGNRGTAELLAERGVHPRNLRAAAGLGRLDMVDELVGTREAEDALDFTMDLRSRLANRVQITTDGHLGYLTAMERAFGRDVDYAMLIKQYGKDTADAQIMTIGKYLETIQVK